MLSKQKIAFIGTGNMARAIIGGLLHGDGKKPHIIATRRNRSALESLQYQYPEIEITTDNKKAVEQASVVVLAVKPQVIDSIFEEIASVIQEDTLVISILAGIPTTYIAQKLGKDLAVIRSMPNTPALVDEGATAISGGKFAKPEHIEIAKEIFLAVGMVEEVSENLMDAVTGLSGSGPAYIYMVIEALTDGGVKQGLPRPQALKLAAQTVYGAAKLVIETGKHPAILRDEVTTPGGTAIAAVADLEGHGLRTMLINAVKTATERSAELRKLREEQL